MEENEGEPEDVRLAAPVEDEIKKSEAEEPSKGNVNFPKKRVKDNAKKRKKENEDENCCTTKKRMKNEKAPKYRTFHIFEKECKHTKPNIVPRHCLSRKEHLDTLATPSRKCEPQCLKKPVIQKLKPISPRIAELARPPMQRILRTIEDRGDTIAPEILNNLINMVETATSLSPEQVAQLFHDKKSRSSKKYKEKRQKIKCRSKKEKEKRKKTVDYPLFDPEAVCCQYLMAEQFVKSILDWKCPIPKEEYRDIAEVILKRLSFITEYTPIDNGDRKSQQMRFLADVVSCWISGVLLEVAEAHKKELEEECERRKQAEEEETEDKEESEEETEDILSAKSVEESEDEEDDKEDDKDLDGETEKKGEDNEDKRDQEKKPEKESASQTEEEDMTEEVEAEREVMPDTGKADEEEAERRRVEEEAEAERRRLEDEEIERKRVEEEEAERKRVEEEEAEKKILEEAEIERRRAEAEEVAKQIEEDTEAKRVEEAAIATLEEEKAESKKLEEEAEKIRAEEEAEQKQIEEAEKIRVEEEAEQKQIEEAAEAKRVEEEVEKVQEVNKSAPVEEIDLTKPADEEHIPKTKEFIPRETSPPIKVIQSDLPFVTFIKICNTLYTMIEKEKENIGQDPVINRLHRAVYEKFHNAVLTENPTLLSDRVKDVIDVMAGKIATWLSKVLTESQILLLEKYPPEVESKEVRDWSNWIDHMTATAGNWSHWLQKSIEEVKKMHDNKVTRGQWEDFTQNINENALLWRKFHLDTVHKAHHNVMMIRDKEVVKTGMKKTPEYLEKELNVFNLE